MDLSPRQRDHVINAVRIKDFRTPLDASCGSLSLLLQVAPYPRDLWRVQIKPEIAER